MTKVTRSFDFGRLRRPSLRMTVIVATVMVVRTWGQEVADGSGMDGTVMSDRVDTLGYQSDFRYTLADMDSLIERSPQVLVVRERIRVRNSEDSFWKRISLHVTYDPIQEDAPAFRPSGWVGFSLPVGRLFSDTRRLDDMEVAATVRELKIQARDMMNQRDALLVELELEVQKYQTAAMKARKTEVSLAMQETSSDAVLEAQDLVAERLADIRKTKLSIHLVEARLKALIGEL